MRLPFYRVLGASLALSGLTGWGTEAEAGLTLTQAGIDQGFGLSTFATGFASNSNIGPLGISFSGNSVLVSDNASGGIRVFHSDANNQTVASAGFVPYGGPGTVNAMTQIGGTIYVGEYFAGRLIEINGDGTFNRNVITGLSNPTGLVVNPNNNHIFLSNSTANQVLDIDPIARTSTVFATAGSPDGLSVSPDGTTLYVAASNHILGFNIATHARVFDSGVINTVDGTIAGVGPLAGLIFGNTNDGRFVEVNLTTGVQTVIANGGSRGDYVTLDPNNGTLLLTQSNTILRLTAPEGGFAVPEPPGAVLAGTGMLALAGFGLWRKFGSRGRTASLIRG